MGVYDMAKNKEMRNGCNNVSFGIYAKKSVERMLGTMIWYLNEYKNDFIEFCNGKIDEYASDDKRFKDALEIKRNKKFGVALYDNEKAEEVRQAEQYLRDVYLSKEIRLCKNFTEWKKEYSKNAKGIYNIYVPENARTSGLDNVLQGYDKMFKDNGKSVSTKKSGQLFAMYSKPEKAKDKETGEISTKQKSRVQGWIEIVKKEDKYYIRIWDCRKSALKHIYDVYDEKTGKFTTKSGDCPNHKYIYIPIHVNKKDVLQTQILDESIYRGNLKIARVFKGKRWRYYLQVNFENKSPILESIKRKTGKVAINTQTQTVAFCDMKANQGITELVETPFEAVMEIKKNQQFMDRSRRAMNKELFNEDGTIKYTRKYMKENNLKWTYSKNYSKASKRNKALYGILARNRKLNNRTTAKYLLGLGSDFVVDNNAFRNWSVKKCHMSKGSRDRVDKTQRVKDYSKQIHDRAPGMVEARIEQVCSQSSYRSFRKIGHFSTSTYNHFIGENDIFTSLNNRLVVFDREGLSEEINKRAIEFYNTFMTIHDADGNHYIVQRDVYGASKMLFLYEVEEERVNKKTGKKYKAKVEKFDAEGYAEWFKEVFYPKHLELIEYLIGVYNLGAELNGTILGTQTKIEKISKKLYKNVI